MHKLIVLDRDGVINEDRDDYVKSADEWRPIPGSLEAMARLSQAGWDIAIATNQSGIGRGLFDMQALNAMHNKMLALLSPLGAKVAGIFFCPHTPQDECNCRKPLPGLFYDIAWRFGRQDLSGVPVVGDSRRDIEAGVFVGCQPYLVLTGKGQNTYRQNDFPVQTKVRVNLSAVAQELAP
jgi:D-glycero-D-manno-heptose 1,7-bisphosphate phosphatase